MSYTAAILTISDKGARGEREDKSGPVLCELAAEHGYQVVYTAIIPDEKDQIQAELIKCSDELHVNLVLTTGGTGFSPRDVTPEATLAVVERETRGIPEAMRMESMKITPRGCLSRSAAGIRGRTLIINLPGSPKAARENVLAVIDAIQHGMEMLMSEGSADCAQTQDKPAQKKQRPSIDAWLSEAKKDPNADQIGMYLTHNGVVRRTAKAQVRAGEADAKPVTGMHFTYNAAKMEAAVAEAKHMPGIYYVKAWLNEGELAVGDDIMLVLVGGDIRPHVVDALQALVGKLKTECVTELERA